MTTDPAQNPPPADLVSGAPAGRWAGVVRTYSRDDVERLRGSVRVQHTLADRGARRLWQLLQDGDCLLVPGAFTQGQAVDLVRAGLQAIHVGDPEPDLRLADRLTGLVHGVNRALRRADEIEHCEGRVTRDWLVPLVTDGSAGLDGALHGFELTRSLVEAGAAAVCFEDGLCSGPAGVGGREVVVPTGALVRTLVAARLAADVAGVPTVLVARTDGRGATLLSSDADPRDREFVVAGERTTEGFFRLRGGIELAIARARACAPYADVLCLGAAPDLAEARRFAEGVHELHPGKPLACCCPPSPDETGRPGRATDARLRRELAAMGYRLHLETTTPAEWRHPRPAGTGYLELVAQAVSGEARR